MWALFGKPLAENYEKGDISRVHIDHPTAADLFRRQVTHFLHRLYAPPRRLAVLCIGTDRSTGDCLGPLIGTRLSRTLHSEAEVLGTLDQPVHAVNLEEALSNLHASGSEPFIIAIDACLGRTESVGYISLKEGPLQPGTGVNKTLPPVGDFHIVGIVNVGGFMEYLVLQNTRLSLVMHMAEIIADGLAVGVRSLLDTAPAMLEPALAQTQTAVSQPVL